MNMSIPKSLIIMNPKTLGFWEHVNLQNRKLSLELVRRKEQLGGYISMRIGIKVLVALVFPENPGFINKRQFPFVHLSSPVLQWC